MYYNKIYIQDEGIPSGICDRSLLLSGSCHKESWQHSLIHGRYRTPPKVDIVLLVLRPPRRVPQCTGFLISH